MLGTAVPQIPSDADVVVLEAGTNDLALEGSDPSIPLRVPIIGAAIHARAPRARIVFNGTRYFKGCIPATVDAWNAALKIAAAQYGAFVDLSAFGPQSEQSPAFPDGGHPSLETAQRAGAALAEVIRPWLTSRASAIH